MNDLSLPDALTERIQAIAEREQLSVEEVITRMIEHYPPRKAAADMDETPNPDPLIGLIGLLDGETQATDLSSTIRETLAKNTHPQYGWTKRDRTD